MRIVPEHLRKTDIGDEYDRLTVIGVPFYCKDSPYSKTAVSWVVVKCECGTVLAVRVNSLRRQHTRSCGCARNDAVRAYGLAHRNMSPCDYCGTPFYKPPSSEKKYCSWECNRAAPKAVTHGESHSRLYGIWTSMKLRCNGHAGEVANALYHDAGVIVCDEWESSYEAFRDWAVTHGYADSLEIDRRDCNGNYEPNNCRWVTRQQQSANERKRRPRGRDPSSRFKGVHKTNSGSFDVRCRGIKLGIFRDEVSAALAYDTEARRQFGEYARLNFPEPGEQGALR